MSRIGVFTPERAKMISDLVDSLKAMGYLDALRSKTPFAASSEPLLFKNDSGEEIPAYACMQVTGTIDEDERNYLLVDKPADIFLKAGPYVFNGPEAVPNPGYGTAKLAPGTKALTDGTITATARYSPVAGQWYLSKTVAGLFVCYGSDDIDDDIAKMSIEYGTVLYRFTLNGSLASGTATADILLMDGTDTGHDETVRDPLAIFSTLTTDDAGLCLLQDGKFYVIQAPC